MRVLMVSMFFCFISVMPELAVSRVNLAKACTYASLSSWRQKEGAVFQCDALWRWPFIQQYLDGEDARYPDSAADALQAQWCHLSVIAVLKANAESSKERRPRQLRNNIRMKYYLWNGEQLAHLCLLVTLNIGLTCSRCVALVKGAWTWLTASIRALAVLAICSISKL